MSAAKTKAEQIIADNPVGMLSLSLFSLLPSPPSYHLFDLICTLTIPQKAVFSKSYCPYCRATKQLLSDFKVQPYIIELDQVGMYSFFPSHPMIDR
jgi:hypothetical protein